jgi:acyl carrier protein
MMRGQVADRVITCIREATNASAECAIEPASHLRGQLRMDSLDICEIILKLEENFIVQITEAEADKWETVSDVIATVERGTHAS